MKGSEKLLVIDVAALSASMAYKWEHPPGGLTFHDMEPSFPAVTCTAQATFRTAGPPSEHGMIANGRYFPELKKSLFWEQAASLVGGPRIWGSFRERGGKVGIMFWQQSLGEGADLIVSPKPVHKHSGGMIQDCYTEPHDLYKELVREIGRPFNLMHYWGPLASRKSSEWIVEATCLVMEREEWAPDLLLTYLPHLDYDLQGSGPDSRKGNKALRALGELLDRLCDKARARNYEILIFGDYAIGPVTVGAVFPNRLLRESGLFKVREVRHMAYPDLFSSRAFAMVDHEIAHVYVTDKGILENVRSIFEGAKGIGEVLDREGRAARGIDHPNSGDLVLVAEEGSWFAYPWWSNRKEAPDFATHVDIHNKPGFDPCELFFGWPPGTVSLDTGKVRGTHGRTGPGRETAWASTLDLKPEPANMVELSRAVQHRLDGC